MGEDDRVVSQAFVDKAHLFVDHTNQFWHILKIIDSETAWLKEFLPTILPLGLEYSVITSEDKFEFKADNRVYTIGDSKIEISSVNITYLIAGPILIIKARTSTPYPFVTNPSDDEFFVQHVSPFHSEFERFKELDNAFTADVYLRAGPNTIFDPNLYLHIMRTVTGKQLGFRFTQMHHVEEITTRSLNLRADEVRFPRGGLYSISQHPSAQHLMTAALRSVPSVERLVLLYACFEAIIGAGEPPRKILCDDIGSDLVRSDLELIHDIRNNALHRKAFLKSYGEACDRLTKIVGLSLAFGDGQQALRREYEILFSGFLADKL